MSRDRPGRLRRLGLAAFKALPARPSYALVRLGSPTFSIGAVALIEHDDRILALRQLHRTGWSLPGGLLDAGEAPAAAVVREIEEETGLQVTAGDVFTTVVDADLRHVDMIFRVVCATRPAVRVASEAIEAGWFRLDELPDPDGPTRRILAAVRHASRAPRPGRLRSDDR